MVNYQCKRCGYSTHIRTHYRNHLYKKFICPPNLSKIPRSKLCREFEDLLKDTPIYSTFPTKYKSENKKDENWHTKNVQKWRTNVRQLKLLKIQKWHTK